MTDTVNPHNGTTATIKVLPATDTDIPTLFDVMSAGFGHSAPFLDIYFPSHDTEQGRISGVKRLLEWKQSSPASMFLKAVTVTKTNTDSQEQQHIIGLAVWTHMNTAPSAELDQLEDVKAVWPDVGDREFMTRLWRSYVVPRSQVINEAGEAGVWVLELLGVHKDYQRLGAGSALVKWGTDRADAQRLETIVEGTPAGRRTYEKCGFRTEIPEMKFDVGEELEQGRKMPVLLFMRRKAVK